MVKKHESCVRKHSTPTHKPCFFQSAHIHLIDALMTAYMLEMISVEKVVSSVKRFSTLSAKELPFDLEEAMLFWINKVTPTRLIRSSALIVVFPCRAAASWSSQVTMKMREILEKELKLKHHLLDSPSHQKVKHHPVSHTPLVSLCPVCQLFNCTFSRLSGGLKALASHSVLNILKTG